MSRKYHPFDPIFTIGYQGRTIAGLVEILKANRIDVLLDIRYTPWSRRPDFRKGCLSRTLEETGIRYVHLRHFGSTPALRDDLHATGRWERFAEAYIAHLESLNGNLDASLEPYSNERVCLLCLESNPHECHRSLLAAALLRQGLASSVVHL